MHRAQYPSKMSIKATKDATNLNGSQLADQFHDEARFHDVRRKGLTWTSPEERDSAVCGPEEFALLCSD